MFDSRSSEISRKNEEGLIGVGALIVFISIVIISAVAAGLLINSSLSLQQQARASTEETISQITSGINVIDAKGRTNANGEVDDIQIIIRPYPGAQSINLENTVIQLKTEGDVSYLNFNQDYPYPLFTVTGDNVDNMVDNLNINTINDELEVEFQNENYNITDDNSSVEIVEEDEWWEIIHVDNVYTVENYRSKLYIWEGSNVNEFNVYNVQDTSGSGRTELRELGDIARVSFRLLGESTLGTNESASITFVPNTGFKTYYKLFVPAALSPDEWYIL